MFCGVHTNSIGSTQALLNAITENIYNHLVNFTLEYFGDKQTNQAASQLLFLPESFCPDPRGSIRCTSFPFECIYFVKLNLLRLAPLKSWPGQSSSCTSRGLKTWAWCGAQALRHTHDVYKKPPLVLCSWQVWGEQFISTLGKVPLGLTEPVPLFQAIISGSKVSIETPLTGGQIPSGSMARSKPAAQPYRKLTHNTKLSKAEAQFPSIVLTDLSHQNQGTRVVYLVFICIIPQRRCIFSNIADLDIFFNECSHVNDAELFSDLHYRPRWICMLWYVRKDD